MHIDPKTMQPTHTRSSVLFYVPCHHHKPNQTFDHKYISLRLSEGSALSGFGVYFPRDNTLHIHSTQSATTVSFLFLKSKHGARICNEFRGCYGRMIALLIDFVILSQYRSSVPSISCICLPLDLPRRSYQLQHDPSKTGRRQWVFHASDTFL